MGYWWIPNTVDEGSCAGHNKNAGPRSTLGLVENDTSGGIRTLSTTVYNGAAYLEALEKTGAGSNWACLGNSAKRAG